MRPTHETDPMVLFFNPRNDPRKPRSSHAHVEGFNNLLKYLVRLRRDGTLEDDDFSELVKIASAAFIEVEILDKVENVLENKGIDDYLLGLWK